MRGFVLSRLLIALLFLGASSLYAQNIILIALNPGSGPAGSAIAMTATGFTTGVAVAPGIVTFTPRAGGSAITVTGTVQGAGLGRTINFIVPSGPTGTYDVTFARPGVTSTNSLPFTLSAPAIFTLSPDTGSQGTLVPVTITLSNPSFSVGATASFGPGILVGNGIAGGFGELLPTALPSQATAWLTILPGAIPGPRTVQVGTSNGLLLRSNASR